MKLVYALSSSLLLPPQRRHPSPRLDTGRGMERAQAQERVAGGRVSIALVLLSFTAPWLAGARAP